MLGRRRRRVPNIETTLGEWLVYAGLNTVEVVSHYRDPQLQVSKNDSLLYTVDLVIFAGF